MNAQSKLTLDIEVTSMLREGNGPVEPAASGVDVVLSQLCLLAEVNKSIISLWIQELRGKR